MPGLIPQAMTGTLLDLCLESPGARSRSRPSSAPIRHGKRRSKDPPHGPSRKALGHRSPTCGVCGRPSAKTGPELPFEWVNLYQESSNPKHGWKSCKTIHADVGKSKGSPVEAEDVPPKEFILPPTRLPRPKPMPRIFQTAEEVESQVEAWRRRVLGGGRNLRCRQTSVVDFVDHVLAGAELSSPKGADTVKLEPGTEHDPGDRGWNTPVEEADLPEVAPVEKALTLDMNTTFISAADRFSLNQIFGQLSVNGDLYVDRVAEGIEVHEGKGSDKEWVREILREHFPGRLYLERADFIDFVNMYRRHRHAFMQKIFSEVDQDGSKSVSLEEIVVLLGRRGITPVLSCVERIFREVTGERTVRDLSFDEFVQIYDVVQARAGFSEHDLARLRKVWSRYDQDGNQVLSADEVRLALDWQGFVVDSVEVESLVHEVGQRKGLNQHEFLTFMRKYRDFEVQKFMQLNDKLSSGENAVTLADLPRLLEEIGYEDVAPEVLQECAALVHLVNRDMAVGITSLNPTFTFDGVYHFLENLRASHGFINDERVDLRNAFLRFSTEQFSKSGFIEEDDGSSSAPENVDEEARISVLKLFHTLRWLGYQMELWQVEKMDSIRMVGSATLCQDEFMRVMAVVHKQEIESIKTMLGHDEKQAPPSTPQGHSKTMSDGHEAEADGHQVTTRRLKRVFHYLGYPMATQELVSISKEFAQGYFSQDVWGVAQVLRRHRKKVREKVRKNFGFASLELHHLQEAFETMGGRPPHGKLKGKLLSNAVRELFPGAEKDQQERSRAHLTLKQVTRSPGNCDELNFQDFLHIVRLRLDCAAEAKLNEEYQALESLNFVPEEVTEFRIIFHKIARDEQGSMATGLFAKVSAIPMLSFAAVEAMLTGIAGQCTDLKREALQDILEEVDQEKKGSLYFWEFLRAVRQLMDTNWSNINDEAQKLVFASWAATEADALYNARLAEFTRRMED